MLWATRAGVKFDRSACAWLILRHIDPQATFGFYDADGMQQAIAVGANPFHNVTYAGPGKRTRSSFEELVTAHDLVPSDPALARMVAFIHNGEIVAEASGVDDPLRAIAKGVNVLVHSDQAMIDQMLPIYDALYAYCKRKAAGSEKWASLEPGWAQT